MIYGITTYENKCHKYKSSNIGDYVQTLAQINIYKRIISNKLARDIPFIEFFEGVMSGEYGGFKFLFVPRDNLTDFVKKYPNEDVHIVMNGWFMHGCDENKTLDWPPPANIKPFFISFHVSDRRMFDEKYLDYWKKHQPIGCRDMATMEKFKRRGVDAYFTGCLTLTIDFLEWKPTVKRTAIIDVGFDPDKLYYKFDMFRHMICKNWSHTESLRFAYDLLKKYSRYERVITSRLHAYLPCLSMGVPVEFVSPQGSPRVKTWGSPDRFDGVRGLNFSDISRIRKNIYDKVDEYGTNL